MQQRIKECLGFMSAAILVAACSGETATGPVDAGLSLSSARIASAPAPDRATARYEIDFMKDMIDHHSMALEMAGMCLEKDLEHPELKELCTDIVEAQEAESGEMQAWLGAWYGVSYEPEMKTGDMKMMEKLAALEGEGFEVEFMQMMIKHHQKAIREGEQCVKRAYHAELGVLCGNIITAQTAEIALMRSWLCEWYGMCKKEETA